MNMGTYGAIQDIKYALKTRKPCEENRSVKVFSRSHRLYSTVDPKISNGMRHSYLQLRQKRSEEKDKEKNRKEHFEITKIDQTTAKEMKENSATLAAHGRTKHQKIIDQAYKPKKPSLDCSSLLLLLPLLPQPTIQLSMTLSLVVIAYHLKEQMLPKRERIQVVLMM